MGIKLTIVRHFEIYYRFLAYCHANQSSYFRTRSSSNRLVRQKSFDHSEPSELSPEIAEDPAPEKHNVLNENIEASVVETTTIATPKETSTVVAKVTVTKLVIERENETELPTKGLEPMKMNGTTEPLEKNFVLEDINLNNDTILPLFEKSQGASDQESSSSSMAKSSKSKSGSRQSTIHRIFKLRL